MTALLLMAVAASPTVDEVIAELTANHKAFRSLDVLDVSYTASYRHLRGHVQNNEPQMQTHLIRHQDNVHVSARYSDGTRWTAAWDGKIGTRRSTVSYKIFKVPPLVLYSLQEYVDNLFYPEARARIEDPDGVVKLPGVTRGLDYWIPDALERNRDKYRVLPNTEMSDNVPCLVLEWPGRDRFWIDPALGYVIRRRDFRRQDGVMQEQVVFRDFQNVSGDLWLPRLIERQVYCSEDDPPNLQNQVSGIETLEVEELKILTPADDQFVVEIPPETRVDDRVRDIVYQRLGPGDDPVADAVATVERELNPGPWRYIGWGLASAVVVVIAIVGYRWWLARAT